MMAETTVDAFAAGSDVGSSDSITASSNRGTTRRVGVVGRKPDRSGTGPTAAVVGA